MKENNGTIVNEKLIKKGIIYVEPNHFTKPNLNTVDVEYTKDLEDYCVYCDLECEISSKYQNIRSKFINIQFTTHFNDTDTHISWLGGSEYGDTRVLTTSYSDVSYRTVQENSKKNNTERELFGINSISIKYDAWVTPTVSIKFTDIRGMSLFSPEEYAHPLYTADGMTGQSGAEDITGSFFRALFTFPYPKFKLYVKGFYGQPICYDMAVNNFKATFDSKTGNFGADVEFVGFKFGLLNDLTMTSLASAVASKEGRDYFDGQITNGRFTDGGNKLYRLSYLAYIFAKFKASVSDLDGQFAKEKESALKEIDEEKEKNKPLEEVWDAYVDYFTNGLCQVAKEVTQTYKDYYTSLASRITTYHPVNKRNLKKEYEDNNYIKELDKINYVSPSHGDSQKGVLSFDILDSQLDTIGIFATAGVPALWGIKGHVTKTLDKWEDGYPSTNMTDIKQWFKDGEAGDLWNFGTSFINASKFTWYDTFFWDDNDTTILPHTDNPYAFYEKYNRVNLINPKTLETVPYNTEEKTTEGWKGQKALMSNIIKKDKINKAAYEKYKVKEKYDKVIKAMKTCLNSVTDENLQKTYKDCFNLFTKVPTLENNCPTYVKTLEACPLESNFLYVNGPNNQSTLVENFVNCGYSRRLSHYAFDFHDFRTTLLSLKATKTEADVDKELNDKRKKAVENLMNDMLDINGGLRFIMKSLWAHVETFLVLCTTTKSNIFSNPRTVEQLGLNKENSNLSRKAYDDVSKMNVGPFPTYLGLQTTENGQERMVYKYIGIDHPELEECSLIERLIYGASRYYNWAHFGEKDYNGNSQNKSHNVYNESTDEIRLAVYSYLQNFFDKWMYSIPNSIEKIQEAWGVDTYFDTHFLFIDVFYNKIGNEVGLNKEKICSMCNDIFEHKNNTLMNFITTILQDVNTILQPTQGFMVNDINNAEQPYKFYDTLFTPVPFNQMKEPESAPFFVVIHRGDPSKHLDTGYGDENDGFMVSECLDEIISEQPVGLKNKNLDYGYLIPAIGVSYGKQYQSYFTDIDLDMNVSMANEVALAAQYNIAGVSVKQNSGSNEHILHLGQDLFTIYANNSYTCTVTMLGCMWIQPLMYFQLNNIPMYRGTYMIQKVYHDIAPGTMTTKFTGVRMSKFSSPFLNKSVSSVNEDINESQLEEKRYKAASFDNDCSYKIYDPSYVDGRGAFTEEWLNEEFGKVFPQHSSNCSIWFNKVKNHTVCEALASIIKYEHSSDDISCGLHATVLYNALYASFFIEYNRAKKGQNIINSDVWSAFSNKNNSEWSYNRWNVIGNEGVGKGAKGAICGNWVLSTDSQVVAEREHICGIVKDVFIHSPLTLVGKQIKSSQGVVKELTEDGLSQIIKTYGYRAGYGKEHKDPLIYQHQTSDKKESGYFSLKNHYHFWTRDSISKMSNNNNKTEDTNAKFGERFLECITKTFNRYENLHDQKFDDLLSTKINQDKQTITFTIKKAEETVTMPLLLDIVFNGNNSDNSYHKYISKLVCNWKTAVSPTTYPDVIELTWDKEGGIVETELSFTQGASNATTFVIEKDTMPEEFYKILKKKYVKLDSNDKLNRYVKNQFG